MTLHWFHGLRSIPNHEVAALWHLCTGCVCCCRAWRRRRLGPGCLRNRRRFASSCLGLTNLFHARRTNCFFSASPAAGLVFHGRLRPVVFSWHRVFLSHADGAPASCLRLDPSLSRCASFPHASGLARLRLVRNDFWLPDQHFRHSPAPDLQREALLVSRNALRRYSIWALRESESLRRIRGIDSPAGPRPSPSRQSAPGTLARGHPIRRRSHRSAFPLCFPGRHCEFRRRTGSLGARDDSAPNNGEATVRRRRRPALGVAYGFLAGRRTTTAAFFFVPVTGNHRREACFHAPGHLADLPS